MRTPFPQANPRCLQGEGKIGCDILEQTMRELRNLIALQLQTR
jgi:hypothetical protein